VNPFKQVPAIDENGFKLTERLRFFYLLAICSVAKNRQHWWNEICACIHFYAQKQLLLSARLSHRNSVRRSVCLSVTQSKTVQARITKSSPSAAWKTLVSETVKLFHIQRGSPQTRALNQRGVGKICDFWPISRCISVMVRDRA